MARPKIVPSIKWSTDWHKRWKYANLHFFVVFLYFQDFGKEQEEENILIFTGGPPDVTFLLCFVFVSQFFASLVKSLANKPHLFLKKSLTI